MVVSPSFNFRWFAAAISLLVLLAKPAWALSQLEATVSQNPVTLGQSVMLDVVANDDVDTNELDTRPLQQDFRVGRVGVSRSTQIANFDAMRETRWQVVLLPRTSGILTIPAFTIDGVSSAPIELEVLAADAATTQANQWVFIETAPSHTSLWPNQPLTVNVKLYLGADLQRGALNAPTMADALVRQIGKDSEQDQIIKGRRYRVIERNYLVTPQKTGELILSPVTFEGDMVLPTRRRDVFGRSQAQPVMLQSDPIPISVNPKPVDYQGPWLVADLISLSDSLDENADYDVGNPITRTLALTAVGTVEENLSEFDIALPDALRLYPDKPERQSGLQNGKLISQLKQNMAIVPSAPGTYTLPEIRLPWWNPQLKRQQWATLPAKTIRVGGALPEPTEIAPVDVPVSTPAPEPKAGFWPWLTLAFASLWLITLWWGWRRGRLPERPEQTKSMAGNTFPELKGACLANRADIALNLLPQWASERLGKPVSLGQLAELMPELTPELAKLQAGRFSHRHQTWQGGALLQLIETINNSRTDQQEGVLPPLDPTSRIGR